MKLNKSLKATPPLGIPVYEYANKQLPQGSCSTHRRRPAYSEHENSQPHKSQADSHLCFVCLYAQKWLDWPHLIL